MASIRCGHCKNTHQSVAAVRACAERGGLTQQIFEQARYDVLGEQHGFPFDEALQPIPVPGLVEKAMDWAPPAPVEAFTGPDPYGADEPREVPSLAKAPVEGVYVKDGVFYKVVQSPSTGNWYAKRWSGEAEGWTYEGRKPLHSLTEENRVNDVQAAHFGHLTGTCVFCARTLTDERSISVGYGPVCAEREGLPWG